MTKDEALVLLQEKVCSCKKCPELVANRTQVVFGSGDSSSRIVFIGEAPGQDEDKQGVPFIGRSGKLLTNIIEACGIDRKDIYICNIAKCRPPNNRAPTELEADNCRPFLDLQLSVISPQFIVCLGAVAAQNLLKTTIAISRLRNKWHEYNGAKVICTYHPAYALRVSSIKNEIYKDLMMLVKEIKFE